MPHPLVVHLKRDKYDVRIDRATVWGNPFRIGDHGSRDEVIARYERWLLNDPYLMDRIGELRGKVLGCWCAPNACHGDILAKYANAEVRV